jgi:hypothetical protein
MAGKHPFFILSVYQELVEQNENSMQLGVIHTFVEIPTLPLTSCVTFKKILHLSVPHFPHLKMEIII